MSPTSGRDLFVGYKSICYTIVNQLEDMPGTVSTSLLDDLQMEWCV